MYIYIYICMYIYIILSNILELTYDLKKLLRVISFVLFFLFCVFTFILESE